MGITRSHIADNLREDTWYITVWPNAGFSASAFIVPESNVANHLFKNSKPIHRVCESPSRDNHAFGFSLVSR